jgi:hypothetical protein
MAEPRLFLCGGAKLAGRGDPPVTANLRKHAEHT